MKTFKIPVSIPTLTRATTTAEMTVAQSLDDLKVRMSRLECAANDLFRLAMITLRQAKELQKPTWMPVEADGFHYSPDRDGWYLVTRINDYGKPYVETDFYDADEDQFDVNDWTEIKAWAEMPIPYQEKEE